MTQKSTGPSSAAGPAYNERSLESLRRIIRSVETYSKRLSSTHGITGPQLSCLLTIAKLQPLTASRIAKTVHVSASTLVGVLDRLEEKELIVRKRDADDRRRIYISLSSKGREVSEAAPAPLQDKLAQALLQASELEQCAIALALEKVVKLMELQEVEAPSELDR